MAVDKSLLDAIESALPAIQVKTLTEQLNRLEEQDAEIANLRAKVNDAQELASDRFDTLMEKGEQITELQSRLTAAEQARDAVTKEARDAEVLALKAALDATVATTDKFLKNTIYRETLQHQVVDEYPKIQTTYQNNMPIPVNVGTEKFNRPVTDVKETESE